MNRAHRAHSSKIEGREWSQYPTKKQFRRPLKLSGSPPGSGPGFDNRPLHEGIKGPKEQKGQGPKHRQNAAPPSRANPWRTQSGSTARRMIQRNRSNNRSGLTDNKETKGGPDRNGERNPETGPPIPQAATEAPAPRGAEPASPFHSSPDPEQSQAVLDRNNKENQDQKNPPKAVARELHGSFSFDGQPGEKPSQQKENLHPERMAVKIKPHQKRGGSVVPTAHLHGKEVGQIGVKDNPRQQRKGLRASRPWSRTESRWP